MMDSALERFILPEDLKSALLRAKWLGFPESREQLLELCFGPTHASRFAVSYLLPGLAWPSGRSMPITCADVCDRDGNCLDTPSGCRT